MFPNNAKSVFIDDHTNTTGLLLEGTTTPRNVYYSKIECDIPNENSITYGLDLTQPNNNNLVNTEYSISADNFSIRTIPENENISYFKTTATDRCNFSIVYTDNVSTSTDNIILRGFSYGETMIILLLIMILSLGLFMAIKNLIFGTKIDGVTKIVSDNSKRL